MPAYNHEKFVGEAIDSVLGQSYPELELIIVDDGSTDKTGDIARSYDDNRITYHYQENQDAFNALNQGMRMSRGSFISIINSDDIYASNRIERLLETHKATSAACIFTDVAPIDDQSKILANKEHPWLVWQQRNKDYYLATMDLYDGFLNGNFMVTTSNLFMTRELARTVGEFTALRYLHDYDYIFRILLTAEDKTVYLHDEQLLCYRIHGGNTLSEAAIVGREQDRQLIRQYLLRKCPPDYHRYINTAINRLIALEHELLRVRARLQEAEVPATAARPNIPRRVINRLKSLASRS